MAGFPGQTNPTPNGGASNLVTWRAAEYYTNLSMTLDQYNGRTEIQQAISDQEQGIWWGRPTLAVIQLNPGITHQILVVGTNWSEINDALRRPQVAWMKIHDPATPAPSSTYSVGFWMNYYVAIYTPDPRCAPCAQQIQVAGQYRSGEPALNQFNAQGGDYVGDRPPNPSGRYRLDGNGNCYWDSTDAGANQCNATPPSTGRFKYDGSGNCYWEPNDSGADQCTPTSGRFKYDGSGNCYWEPNDSGPNQCTPLLAKGLQKNRVQGLFVKATSMFAPPRVLGSRVPLASLTSTASVRTPGNWVNGVSSGQSPQPQAAQPAPTGGVQVPHPHATKASEFVDNIYAAAHQAGLAEAADVPELNEPGSLRARRVLDVTPISDLVAPPYVVVELENTAGVLIANVAISKAGSVMVVESARDQGAPGSLGLDDVSKRVRARTNKAPKRVKYVYARTTAQPGGSVVRPLVAAETEDGVIYFNAAGEAFAEQGTEVIRQFGTAKGERPKPSPVFLVLERLERWE